ncbi:MAG: GNAT family N-acetyltransferase [Mojavia pulchra JT2-VF2]|jgi:predicted acetyltransferase|uniref:GNAT family N-acetyltransferase n=1 Tax=Mojavia pulchra JT2-VF2 TaxID=287848 RepID=A0A951Q284_9NOST|nr:GNAT family N-acetyltransferase [Mojavia pulchra JT2-VF2]
MTPEFEYTTLAHPEDVIQLGTILNQCFINSRDEEKYVKKYINSIGLENFRIIRQDAQVIGGLATLGMGQWWASQRVPMTGIAAVGIAPEYRGSGAAIALMHQTLKELHANGVPISVLYPATQRLYRKAGYEQGGSLCRWEIPTQSIQVKEQPLPLIAVAPIHQDIFSELYQQQAKLSNGYLDRHPAIWQELVSTEQKEKIFAYFIGAKDQPQGYIIFSQERTEDGAIMWIRDWAILTAAAAQSFWSFIANHRSQIKQVRWKSSVNDFLSLLLPEQTAKIWRQQRWMLRVVDLSKALELRGYPSGIQAELHLEVQDDLLSANNGRFILSVANGHGEVTRGGKGELQIDIKGLAPLYTGLFTPYQLQLAGKLDATETALLAATQIFAGVSPGMSDFF